MITLSIDVTKINKDLLRTVTKKDGSKATFLNLVLWENKDGKDAYDNDGFCKQSLTRAQKEEGIQTEILGNWQDKRDGYQAGGKASPAPITPHNRAKADGYAPSDIDDDLPF